MSKVWSKKKKDKKYAKLNNQLMSIEDDNRDSLLKFLLEKSKQDFKI
jgi:hypothetical protein